MQTMKYKLKDGTKDFIIDKIYHLKDSNKNSWYFATGFNRDMNGKRDVLTEIKTGFSIGGSLKELRDIYHVSNSQLKEKLSACDDRDTKETINNEPEILKEYLKHKKIFELEKAYYQADRLAVKKALNKKFIKKYPKGCLNLKEIRYIIKEYSGNQWEKLDNGWKITKNNGRSKLFIYDSMFKGLKLYSKINGLEWRFFSDKVIAPKKVKKTHKKALNVSQNSNIIKILDCYKDGIPGKKIYTKLSSGNIAISYKWKGVA